MLPCRTCIFKLIEYAKTTPTLPEIQPAEDYGIVIDINDLSLQLLDVLPHTACSTAILR